METEKRLIEAHAYYKELCEEMNYPGRSEEFMTAIDVAIADLADAPTVDAVEVVHGEWLFGDIGPLGASVKCSNCGFGVDNADPILWMDYPGHQFCGACGAKMDGERRTK